MVYALIVDVLELAEGLDLVQVFFAVENDVVGAGVEEVVKNEECLKRSCMLVS